MCVCVCARVSLCLPNTLRLSQRPRRRTFRRGTSLSQQLDTLVAADFSSAGEIPTSRRLLAAVDVTRIPRSERLSPAELPLTQSSAEINCRANICRQSAPLKSSYRAFRLARARLKYLASRVSGLRKNRVEFVEERRPPPPPGPRRRPPTAIRPPA